MAIFAAFREFESEQIGIAVTGNAMDYNSRPGTPRENEFHIIKIMLGLGLVSDVVKVFPASSLLLARKSTNGAITTRSDDEIGSQLA